MLSNFLTQAFTARYNPNFYTQLSAQSAKTVADDPYYDQNKQPMIGIVTQTLPDELKNDPRFEGKTSYIAQSYVRFLESAGARVMPMPFDDDD